MVSIIEDTVLIPFADALQSPAQYSIYEKSVRSLNITI